MGVHAVTEAPPRSAHPESSLGEPDVSIHKRPVREAGAMSNMLALPERRRQVRAGTKVHHARRDDESGEDGETLCLWLRLSPSQHAPTALECSWKWRPRTEFTAPPRATSAQNCGKARDKLLDKRPLPAPPLPELHGLPTPASPPLP